MSVVAAQQQQAVEAVAAEVLQSEAHVVFVSVEQAAVAVVRPQLPEEAEAVQRRQPVQVVAEQAEQAEQRRQQREQQLREQRRSRASKHRNPGRVDSGRDRRRASVDEWRADRRQF